MPSLLLPLALLALLQTLLPVRSAQLRPVVTEPSYWDFEDVAVTPDGSTAYIAGAEFGSAHGGRAEHSFVWSVTLTGEGAGSLETVAKASQLSSLRHAMFAADFNTAYLLGYLTNATAGTDTYNLLSVALTGSSRGTVTDIVTVPERALFCTPVTTASASRLYLFGTAAEFSPVYEIWSVALKGSSADTLKTLVTLPFDDVSIDQVAVTADGSTAYFVAEAEYGTEAALWSVLLTGSAAGSLTTIVNLTADSGSNMMAFTSDLSIVYLAGAQAYVQQEATAGVLWAVALTGPSSGTLTELAAAPTNSSFWALALTTDDSTAYSYGIERNYLTGAETFILWSVALNGTSPSTLKTVVTASAGAGFGGFALTADANTAYIAGSGYVPSNMTEPAILWSVALPCPRLNRQQAIASGVDATGRSFIAMNEGFGPFYYLAGANRSPSIGYGHDCNAYDDACSASEFQQGYLTQQQADAVLDSDIDVKAHEVYSVWRSIQGLVLTTNQFNVLVDIAFQYSGNDFTALTYDYLSEQASAPPDQEIPLHSFSDWVKNLSSDTTRDAARAQLAAQCSVPPGDYSAAQYDGQSCSSAGNAGVCLSSQLYSYSGPAPVRGDCVPGYHCFLFPSGSPVALVNVNLTVTLRKAPYSIDVQCAAGPGLVG